MSCVRVGGGNHPEGQVRKHFNRIISSQYKKSDIIFLIAGFEHQNIMKSIDVNFIIFESLEALDKLTPEDIQGLKEELKRYKPFFISTNEKDFIGSLQLYKKYFQKIVKRLHLIDLETLKATELITADELAKNDYPIGLRLPAPFTFKDYVDEVEKEERYKPQPLALYLNQMLQKEISRSLQSD